MCLCHVSVVFDVFHSNFLRQNIQFLQEEEKRKKFEAQMMHFHHHHHHQADFILDWYWLIYSVLCSYDENDSSHRNSRYGRKIHRHYLSMTSVTEKAKESKESILQMPVSRESYYSRKFRREEGIKKLRFESLHHYSQWLRSKVTRVILSAKRRQKDNDDDKKRLLFWGMMKEGSSLW